MFWRVWLSCHNCRKQRCVEMVEGPGVDKSEFLPCPECGEWAELKGAHMFPMTCDYCEYLAGSHCRYGIQQGNGVCPTWKLRSVLDEQ